MPDPHAPLSSQAIGRLRSALLPAWLGAALLVGCASGKDVGETVDRFAEREGFHGVVLVARGDSVLVGEAYGFEDVEAQAPTRLTTRYQVGSIAKWVTSIVVLTLVDEGVLDLDAPIATYLPDYRADVGERVTLHHLLANRSGVPNDLVAAYEADPAALDAPLSTRAAVRRFASGALHFEPGTDYDYSHTNWILVQAVVEARTGAPLSDAVRERVVRPLGLADTGAFWDGGPDAGIAPGYEAPTPERADPPAPRYLVGTGGLYSTAPDLLALVHALDAGRLLSDASRERLVTVYTPDADLSAGGAVGGYAYGGRVRAMALGGEVRTVLWHTGSNGPWKTRVSRVLGDGLTVVTVTNADTEHGATGVLTEAVLTAAYR